MSAATPVKVWEQDVSIPTYAAGAPDANPMFYFGRAYQGAEGRVYPYPLYDTLTNQKIDKTYRLVYLENEYVKIGVLPEIGGRIFSAEDKTNGYDFFYRQHVIKPALIGMLGAWISGGVEWNVPHHHRPSSFLPVQHRIEEHPDGSKTVWVGELEIRHRMRWLVGLTLRPGVSYLEANLRVVNRTPVVNTLLAWANVAVHANENYQVIFPPSTQFGTHHSKREFIRWPVADSFYGGSDFTRGVDVSWYRNHQFGNSIFAWNDEDDFLAGYDHGKQAGTLSISDHHMVPGKKLWTWGNGPGGRLWDKILSDTDGPYIELMVGALSDNQPDYSWIQPYETKDVTLYWYPFRDIGGVKQASLDAAVNLEVANGKARVGFYATRDYPVATAKLTAGDRVLAEEKVAISPAKAWSREIILPLGIDPRQLRASLTVNGKELVSYAPVQPEPRKMPDPVTPPKAPQDIATNEELYLAGLRIDQFHNPALDPEQYWDEALRRDPGDSRVHTAYGILEIRHGRFADAERHLRAALARLSTGYTSPKDGEAQYYLGVALKAQGKISESYDAFYKAAWSAAWQAQAYFGLAEVSSLRGDLAAALRFVDLSLQHNTQSTRALNLRASLLRHLNRDAEAKPVLAAVAAIDPLDVRLAVESGTKEADALLRENPSAALETAVEYADAGLWADAAGVLRRIANPSPLMLYHLAYYTEKSGDRAGAEGLYRRAAAGLPNFVFPFESESIPVLKRAMEFNPRDARAPYYLGNLLFDWQPAEAVRLWEQSRALDPSFPTVHRNLAMAYWKKSGQVDQAIASMEKAIEVSGRDAIHYFELDQMYEAAGTPPARRLEMLTKHHEVVARRDDALAREVQLLVFAGKFDRALELMQGRRFNVWEGGARFSVHDSWTDAHLGRGRLLLAAGKARDALAEFAVALEYPETLQVARFVKGGRHPEGMYWIAQAYAALGDKAKANQYWTEAAADLPNVGQDDILPTTDRTVLLYYQASALRALGQESRARALFEQMVRSGEMASRQKAGVDVFAKFGEGQTQRARAAQAFYIAGLGHLGLSRSGAAKTAFDQALAASPDHLGAQTALGWIH